jgi:hypothetical protein
VTAPPWDEPKSNALLLWLTALSTVASQAGGRPIDLMQYATDEHRDLQGTLGPASPQLARRRVERASQQVLEARGLDPAIARRISAKILDREAPDNAEIQAVTAVGGVIVAAQVGSD